MFVGHLAPALAAKRAVPKAPLGWLMAAVTALDLVWPLFRLAGIEHVRMRPGATPGIALYLRGRRATRWFGPVAFWSFVAICTVMWATGPWSPPPPNQQFLAWFALIGWIVLPWTAIADRYYAPAAATESA